MTNPYEYMDKVNELFKLKKGSTHLNYKQLSYIGLLYPTELYYNYGRPSMFLEISVSGTPIINEFTPKVVISSIDDAGCVIYGQNMSLDKAEKVVERLKLYFESLDYKCPTKDALTEAMIDFNMYVEIY